MARVRVSVRLKFVKLPNIDSERVFRDGIAFRDPDERSYDDLRAMVERKISFMELPISDFTIFYTEEHTGDRLVVDTALFSSLLRQWSRTAAKTRVAVPQAVQGPALLGDSASQPLGYNDVRLLARVHAGASAGSDSNGGSSSCSDDDDDAKAPDVTVCFEVELARGSGRSPAGLSGLALVPDLVRTSAFPPHPTAGPSPAVQFAALTRENLSRLCESKPSATPPGNASAADASLNVHAQLGSTASPVDPAVDQHVRVNDLTCPPPTAKFFLRCVPLSIRFKTPKPGVTVAEMDLGDAEDVTQAITAVTFDDAVHKAIRDHLRSDRRQVLELRQVYVRRKSDVDMRYQTNPHPLLLRLDRSSKLEVVRMLATPAPLPGSGTGVITVREQLGSAGVVDVSQLMGFQLQHNNRHAGRHGGAVPSESGASLLLQGGIGGGAYPPPPMSSSSSSSGPRRTTFTMNSSSGNAGASVALVNGVVPSAFGQELRARQEMLLQQLPPTATAPLEPGVPHVTACDVRQREALVEQHANREEQRKQRIRRKTEVSTRCLLCGLDCSDEEACMAIVREQLTKSMRNRGAQIPTFAEVKRDLCDRRRVAPGKEPTRLLCHHTFVNSTTRTVHAVHPRCAHLCTAYQSGGELEDIVETDLAMNVCSLCGMRGACIACYHPSCTEMYHVVCALYSGGYVNFGQRDPFLPCAACPRHTQVSIPTKPRTQSSGNVLHVDHSCWEDGVAFDSRVVDSTDLRDPDENDGQ